MGFYCTTCRTSFPTRRFFRTHVARAHEHPKPKAPRSFFRYHPLLTAKPCDAEGNELPENAPPLPPNPSKSWEPFTDRPSFEFAELEFKKKKDSKDDINQLLKILNAKHILDGTGVDTIFKDHDELMATIDAIPVGDASWHSFSFDYVAYEEQTSTEGRHYSNFMSGRWAWKESTKIAQDPATRGAMLVSAILGADKTTVSVATGDQEYWPVYASPGNIHNEVRRGHQEGIMPIAFLAIPKGSNVDTDDTEFRIFKKQLYHASLARILSPLKAAMTTPRVTLCPDGHYRKVVYSIGPFIADYPEQVYLSGVVQGWCPKCLSPSDTLEGCGHPRTRELMQCHKDTFSHDPDLLWDTFGLAPGVKPFTDHFPRADIHELLSPDLLHQVIKGTFKDHLVVWVLEYIKANNSAREANLIIDDIDRRLRSVPAFPGLRRFKQGRNFKQWTGNDSKALMKIFIPAIVGYVPDRVVECVRTFLDFCYIARRSSHTRDSLQVLEATLDRFHELRDVFREVDIRNDFALPRQHSLVHLVRGIRLFGSPNGICSSITESKHIRAVKDPWRASSCNEALGQILRMNTRLSKIAAARSDFGTR
ncbi:hypothetical protein OF83DRAFT_1178460, partial [Amylostereum chailletii]